ncbi:nucleotide disphospho-sugar-binding domain-containing protein [Peristeroidobacter soli]|uniref:nucleotide disphospho-sugar-binding domain-containing protein n=1 Tax=Peristeroidobacter soli TaxID=2497877 RepID=UPI0013004A5A|nr:nucleotide disphospho-sugar-binding domain-containing protein [Peristeroidobacter soli]
MEPRHIAVFTPMIGGHVAPALGVCAELVRRGHRVTYPTNESYVARIREAGVTPLELKFPQLRNAEKIYEDVASDDIKYWRAFAFVTAPTALASSAAAVAELQTFYAANPPDLILYDWFAFGGRILAKQLGCPAIQLQSHFAHRNALMRIDGVCTTPEPMSGFGRFLDAFLATYGFEGSNQLWHYEDLNIFCVPREFQYDFESLDGRFVFVGATHNRTPRQGAWRNTVERGRPVILISEATSGTDGSFLRLCLAAFAGSKYHVVVSKAPNTPEPASWPGNFEINRTAFNCEILPFANVMLCQGGMGTTLEALYHGVPVVAVSLNPFNSEVAFRMADLGLGVYVRERGVTPAILAEAVATASSDEAMLARVKRMQSRFATTPGPTAAADAIEGYLAGRAETSRRNGFAR